MRARMHSSIRGARLDASPPSNERTNTNPSFYHHRVVPPLDPSRVLPRRRRRTSRRLALAPPRPRARAPTRSSSIKRYLMMYTHTHSNTYRMSHTTPSLYPTTRTPPRDPYTRPPHAHHARTDDVSTTSVPTTRDDDVSSRSRRRRSRRRRRRARLETSSRVGRSLRVRRLLVRSRRA